MSVSAPSLTCWNSWMMSSARSAPLAGQRGGDRAERLPGGGADLPPGHVVGQRQQRGQPRRDAGRVARVGLLDQPPGLLELSLPGGRLAGGQPAGGRPLVAVTVGVGVLEPHREFPGAQLAHRLPVRSVRGSAAVRQARRATCPRRPAPRRRLRRGPRASPSRLSPTRSRPSVGRCTYPPATGTSSSASVPDLMAAAAAIDARWPASAAHARRGARRQRSAQART